MDLRTPPQVYLTDPLKWECIGELRVIAFITEQKVLRKILDHFKNSKTHSRASPQP